MARLPSDKRPSGRLKPGRPLTVLTLAPLVLAIAAACGGDTGASSSAGSTSSPESPEAAFPVTITHKFGDTEIPQEPKRVVTVGFNEQDFVLALGITPVGVRDFIGSYPEQTRPWAQDQIGGAQLEMVGSEELNFEKIAALEPDLILGVNSFMAEADYTKLSQIAPTVAQSAEFTDGGVPWQEQTLVTGRALGREGQSKELVAEVEEKFAQVVEQHQEFEGKTAAVTLFLDPSIYILEPSDIRMRFFSSLGFQAPQQTGEISREQLGLLDQDVLVVLGVDQQALQNDSLFQSLDVVKDGRVIYFGDFSTDFAGAVGFSSPLSLPIALDIAVPKLAAATAP